LGRPTKGFAPIFNIVSALQAWRISGILKEIIITALHTQVRKQAEKKPKWTMLNLYDKMQTLMAAARIPKGIANSNLQFKKYHPTYRLYKSLIL
jgi:hypothetical protein